MYDIVIVGAGPAGSYLAGRCVESGLKTLVLEEHPQIGIPVHCAGIVSDKFLKEFHVPDDLIQKRLTHFKIFYPGEKAMTCPANIKANVIFRNKFDDYLAGMAIHSGAEYLLSAKVADLYQKEDRVVLDYECGGSKTVEGKLCVLATGSMSDLPFRCGIDRPHEFLTAIQADAEIQNLEGVELFLGNEYAPGSFAYVVSINGKSSKLGMIVREGIKENFRNLVESPFLQGRIAALSDRRVTRRIPVGFPRNSLNRRIIALGDAAGQLKTTTGGGIHYGLICARILSDVIEDSRKGGDFNLNRIASYDRLWKKRIIGELRVGMLFRKFLENISDNDIAAILEAIKQENILRVVEEQADFDFHQRLIIALLRVPELHRMVFSLIGKGLRIFA